MWRGQGRLALCVINNHDTSRKVQPRGAKEECEWGKGRWEKKGAYTERVRARRYYYSETCNIGLGEFDTGEGQQWTLLEIIS